MSDPNRGLSPVDPFLEVEAARRERGAILARWVLGHRRPAGGHAARRLPPGRAALALLPLAAGYFLSYLFRNVNGVVAGDIMRDLGLGADLLGLLTSVYFLTFAAAQLPLGVLLDRYGPRRVQGSLFLAAAAGAGLCALPAGFGVLLLGRALIGVGTAGSLVSGLKAVAQWLPRERQPLANGAFIMCGGLGALAATWPVEFGRGLVGWRGLFLVLAAASCVVALAVWAVVPRLGGANRPTPGRAGLGDIIRDPFFLRFAPLSASCFGTVLAVQGLWAGPWLADVDRLSRPEVASDLAYMALVLIVAAPLWGLVTQKLRRYMRLTRVVGAAALLLIATELMLLRPVGVPVLCPWCLFAAFGGFTVLSYSVLADHFPADVIGRANGALNMLHISTSFAVQLGIGQVVARWTPMSGSYPARAYEAALLLPIAMQALALAWFAWPRRVDALASFRPPV